MKDNAIYKVFKWVSVGMLSAMLLFVSFSFTKKAEAACNNVNYDFSISASKTAVVRGDKFDINVKAKRSGDITDPCYGANHKVNLYFKNSSGQPAYYGTAPSSGYLVFNGENAETVFNIDLAKINSALYATSSTLVIDATIWNDRSGGMIKRSNAVTIDVTGSSGAAGAFTTNIEFWDDKGAIKSQFAKNDKMRILLKIPTQEHAKVDAATIPASLYMVVKVNGQDAGSITRPKADYKSGQYVDTTVTVAKGFKDGANNVTVELWGAGSSTKVSTAVANVQVTGLGTTGGPGSPPGPGGPPGPGSPPGPGNVITGPVEVINPPIGIGSIGELISTLIRWLLIMVGALSVLFIIIGGFRMVVSAGNEQAVTEGKKTVTWAVIGLVVALMAFTIVAALQSVLGRN